MCQFTWSFLHVEDSRSAREFVKTTLQSADPPHYHVESVGTLADAIAELDNKIVDIVVTDITLPDGEGQEIVERVRAHADSAIILVMTCQEDEATAIRCVQLGAADYLFKSLIDAQYLERSIQLALARKIRDNAIPKTLVGDRRRLSRSTQERRKYPRYTLS